eukprot:CAMPEP_0172537262 /NCGR_PEP_ID=MMETSP1067-20121228/8885_1 /TAXON_ID=265564 ORGANISM="Thalassiosira punctigera, Strain Tpunct2005C2" /NCGR_SAMPLE_ID=MMETSP1067 /ASSEMBLY_ACC=CAM_ASM_000444 /LENGTH=1010 /DNA_ID=CAMNT_0013322523 /DNA_START=27 /DNA_END=3056 /DNA_ORIENTATION=-
MDPPDESAAADLRGDGAGEEDLDGGGGSVELQALVPYSARDAPMDPDGDLDLTRTQPPPVTIAPRSSRSRTAAVTATKNVAFVEESGATDGSIDDATKRKKMILLLMSTLFVALVGAVLGKHSAVELEQEIEEGEQEEVFHVHSHVDHTDGETKIHTHIIDLEGYHPTTLVNASDYVLPGTEDAPPLSAAMGRPYTPILNHFQFRDPTSSYAKQWGYFDFEDPDQKWDGKMRPQPNFKDFPNRDVPNSEFPEDAWQRSDQYMKAFLTEAKLLVNRSIEAVYAEYGVGISQDGSITLTEEQWINRAKFAPLLVKETVRQGGGGSWTTKQSMEGSARRLIHHIMTGDTFKLVLGGHSAAAGHGAGFNQSYIIEAGHVLEPVFAHLGVEFRSYNFAQGGMGTIQQSLAGMDLRGKETDWIMWDSKMTERPGYLNNFFLRQALISGNRSPVLMGDGVDLTGFHDVAGASVAAQGNGWIPVTVSEEQVKEVPWAAQYLQCAPGATANCPGHAYTAGCWVEREDFKPQARQEPIVGGQASWHPGNRVHKRRGRMIALIILQTLDYALDKWETVAAEGGGYPIAEEHWHVTDYYKSIREKAKEVGGCFGNNWRIGQKRHLLEEEQADEDDPYHRNLDGEDDFWPPRLCNLPLQGRSLWGPRHNPVETSLLSIMRPNQMGDIDPLIKTNAYMSPPCYSPPDRPAPWTVPPETEPFAPLIGGSRRLTVDEDGQHQHQLRSQVDESPTPGEATKVDSAVEGNRQVPILRNYVAKRVLAEGDAVEEDAKKSEAADKDAIVPGLGLQVHWGRPGVCDGSSHSWCDKVCSSACLMGGAQDNRGMVCFDGLSGWLVFDVKNVKHGFIGARMEPWHKDTDVSITAGWTEVNNGGRGNYDKHGRERELHEEYQHQMEMKGIERMKEEIEKDIKFVEDNGNSANTTRRLGGGQSCGFAGDYTFQWAINGEIVSWSQAEFCKHFTRLNYNVDVLKFMDDESKTGEFELAMRMTNVGRGKVMCITHLYW